jgi:hypothetical protein
VDASENQLKRHNNKMNGLSNQMIAGAEGISLQTKRITKSKHKINNY